MAVVSLISAEGERERLVYCRSVPGAAFSVGEKSDAVSVYDWHRRMGHRSMKTIIDMADGAVTGIVLKDIPNTRRSWAAARPALLQRRNAFRSMFRATRTAWSLSGFCFLHLVSVTSSIVSVTTLTGFASYKVGSSRQTSSCTR